MNESPTGKASLAEHTEYLEQIVRLKLFFLHAYLEKHPGESFRDVLRNRVDIYRKTALNTDAKLCPEPHFDDPAWLAMEDRAEHIYKDNLRDRAAFEEKAFSVFRDSLRAHAELDYLATWMPVVSECGSIIPEKKIKDDGVSLAFHIANAVAPVSIFQDPAYLPNCFRKLLDVADSMGAKEIICSTWLNSHPRWVAYFPEEWALNRSEPETNIEWHFGFWGQFISARKTFNAKYGAILRETGHFPFGLRFAHCSVASMRKKLDSSAK